MSKIGRNDSCPCGSGNKYKRCCFDKKDNPVPIDVIEHFQKVMEEQEYFKKIGIHINYAKPVIFNGKKVFALGNKIYANCPQNTTFHEFLIEILKGTIGLDWFREQATLSANRRHFISVCLEKTGECIERSQSSAKRINNEVVAVTLDGYSKSLLSLAFDVCSLIHSHKLPPPLLERLKNRDQYQGARYEIAIAAIFSRLECDIEFTDGNSKNKHCEFVATHKPTGSILAVEAKSKHRFGVLHQLGLLAPIEKLLSARMIKRLFNEALEQNPKDVPFAVFIDVNSPITPDIGIGDKPWVKDVKNLINRKLSGVVPQEYPLNAAFFTNFSYHYQAEDKAERGEAVSIVIPHPKFPPPNFEFFGYIKSALDNYGIVPPIDIDLLFDSRSTN